MEFYNAGKIIHLEIVCSSIQDALNAFHHGATRIECCSALELGGCTPSIATLKAMKVAVPIPIVAMVRTRGGDFIYSEDEKFIMKEDAMILCEANADGLVFGSLTKQRQVDEAFTRSMVDIAHQFGIEAVFHKAIDLTDDYEEAIRTLIACGVDRVLTNGGTHDNVLLGTSTLSKIQANYGSKIQILVGGGVRYDNALRILTQTQCTQLHSGAKRWVKSRYHHDHIEVDPQSVYLLAQEIKKYDGGEA